MDYLLIFTYLFMTGTSLPGAGILQVRFSGSNPQNDTLLAG